MTAEALYHSRPPGPLMKCLYYTFDMYDGTHVSYLRQEAPMRPCCDGSDAAHLVCVRGEFLAKATELRDIVRRVAELEQIIRDLWEEMTALEAAQRRGPRAAAEEAG